MFWEKKSSGKTVKNVCEIQGENCTESVKGENIKI